MKTIEAMFGLDEATRNATIQQININTIQPYPNQPFKRYKEAALKELAEDIKMNGLIHPIIIRPIDRGQYQMISGHNRLEACKQLGWSKIDAVIKELNDSEAQLMLVQANLVQRHHFSNKEKAFAYKMRHDSLKRQGKKGDTPYSSFEEMAGTSLDSPRQIDRYIKTTQLIDQWMEEFDNKEIPLPCAEIIAGMDKENQYHLYLYTQENGVKISTKIVKEASKIVKEGKTLTDKIMGDIFSLTTKDKTITTEDLMKQYQSEKNNISLSDKKLLIDFLSFLKIHKLNLSQIHL